MPDETADSWIAIAAHKGLDGDIQADLLASTPRGAGIEAIRLPFLATTTLRLHAWPMIQPAEVLVRAEWEEEAREIAATNTPASVMPEVRLWFGCWLCALLLQLTLGGLALGDLRQQGLASALAGATEVAAGLIALFLLRATALLLAALVSAGRLRLDARPAIAALMCCGALAALVWLIRWAGLLPVMTCGVLGFALWRRHRLGGSRPPTAPSDVLYTDGPPPED